MSEVVLTALKRTECPKCEGKGSYTEKVNYRHKSHTTRFCHPCNGLGVFSKQVHLNIEQLKVLLADREPWTWGGK